MNVTDEAICFVSLKYDVPVEMIRAVMMHLDKLTDSSGRLRDAGRDHVRAHLLANNIYVRVYYSEDSNVFNGTVYVDTDIELQHRNIIKVSNIIQWINECK